MKRLLPAAAAVFAAVFAVLMMISTAGAVNTENRYLLGDADGDGRISVSDVTSIQRHLADILPLAEADRKAADVNLDGSVTVDDATVLQCYLAEFETAYPIGETAVVDANGEHIIWSKPGENQLPFV